MKQKLEILPKLVFIIILMIGFTVIYLFGPTITGFYIYDGPSLSGNYGLILGIVFVLILLAFVVLELMVKIKKF